MITQPEPSPTVEDQEGDWSPVDDPNASPFNKSVDELLHLTAEIARQLVPSHQSAAALIVNDEWKDMRKYFSLSPKYAQWYNYRTPAAGVGIHAMVVESNSAVRLTQAELEKHPNFTRFGTEEGKHPPMRGWLAVPIVGSDGRNYGLLQLSDKYDDADFTEEDEAKLKRLAQMTAIGLSALCRQYHKHHK